MTQFIYLLSEYGYYIGFPLALLGIVLWIYRPSAKKRYEADGNIPFRGDKNGKRLANPSVI